MRDRIALLFLVLASGCARNAILELELELPPQPDGAPLFAVVQAQNELGFDQPWPDVAFDGVALVEPCMRADLPPPCDDRILDPSCSAVVSVVGDADDLEEPLRIRVRFCTDARCNVATDASAVEQRIEIERAFYLGRYTQARACIDQVPTATAPDPLMIERCEVRCREGTASMQCRLDGTHFCE